ncbi:hypothetical protein BH23ACT11_BH23ACT11_17880 [soil metagenome]
MSGAPLHPVDVLDRLSRLYVYTLKWMDTWMVTRPRPRLSFSTAPPRLGRWIGQRAPSYPFIFSTWLEYPEVFDDVDADALAEYLERMPHGLASFHMDEALRTILDIDFPGLRQHGLQPRSWWQILELPGSAGRYSSLMCQVYPELKVTRNCTVVCQNWNRTPQGIVERAAAGVYALLAGEGEGSKSRILESMPRAEREYDLIIGLPGVATEDDARLNSMLTTDGRLMLLEEEFVPAGVTRLR